MARNPRSVEALTGALDREADLEIQVAILAALGNHPTTESVDRLTHAAQPGGLLHRRPVLYRLAAVQALADAGTHASIVSLRALANDRDREVRSTVDRLIATRAAMSGTH